MKICWKAFGFSTILDLGTAEDYHRFVNDVVCDPKKATEILEQLRSNGEAIVDQDQPEDYDHYIRLNDAPVYRLEQS